MVAIKTPFSVMIEYYHLINVPIGLLIDRILLIIAL
jgi:hypothetical protein